MQKPPFLNFYDLMELKNLTRFLLTWLIMLMFQIWQINTNKIRIRKGINMLMLKARWPRLTK